MVAVASLDTKTTGKPMRQQQHVNFHIGSNKVRLRFKFVFKAIVFTCMSARCSFCGAQLLTTELIQVRAVKYACFELKSIVVQGNNFRG